MSTGQMFELGRLKQQLLQPDIIKVKVKHKQAIVFPKLKKDNLDVTQLKNYRPISNLSFLSKLLESAVQKRLQSFLR